MTTQIPDQLLYKGEVYYLNEELLEPFFKAFPDKKPKVEVMTTALWRGYIAAFEIRDDQLFVSEIEMYTDMDLGKKSVLNQVFPDTKKFEWYAGLIRIDKERGMYDREKPGTIFEFLEILHGNLIQKRIMDYDQLQQFKAEQFGYFKMTETYEEVFGMWRGNNKDMTDDEIDKRIEEAILYYTREVYVE